MNNLNVSPVGIVVQSFAAFVGLSVLLGRIYFLAYYEAIGIPPSLTEINLLDYSIISPDVTILGISVVIVVGAIYTVLTRYVAPTGTLDWERVAIGVCIALAGISTTVFIPQDHPLVSAMPIGSVGLLWGISSIAPLAGGIIFASGLPVTPLELDAKEEAPSDGDARARLQRLSPNPPKSHGISAGAWVKDAARWRCGYDADAGAF